MLRFSKLAKAYGLKVLLDDVDLDLPASGRIALIGANGSGKTTLLNIIAGQEPADGGSVIKTAAYRVGYLPQHPNPVPQPTLLQECISGARSLFAMKTRMSELLTVLHELPGDKDALAAYEEMEARFRTGGGYAIEARASEILT